MPRRHRPLGVAAAGLALLTAALAGGHTVMTADAPAPFIVVLGVAQDAGAPQAGCRKPCCAPAATDPSRRRHVVSLGLVDPVSGDRWLFEATPDLREQLRMLDEVAPPRSTPDLAGVFLTHGHIGHYTGLMFLGHESMGAKHVPTYVMPRMAQFLASNGPWDQLVRYENLALVPLAADTPVRLNDRISVTPFAVPHREEYTEVVGFRIEGPERSILFIPDIDKWDRWDQRLEDELATVDAAYVDGTFYADGELPGRDMSAIPHPFIAETMQRLASLPPAERAKVRFIHLNHTNPALHPDSTASRAIEAAGFFVAREGERLPL